MLYKNMKEKGPSPHEDTEFFVKITGILKGDTLTTYMPKICLDYVILTSVDLIKEKGFALKKTTRNRYYIAESMTNADYTDALVLLTNTQDQAKSLLSSMELATVDIDLYMK